MDHQFNFTDSSQRVIASALFGFWLSVPLTIFAFSKTLIWLITGQIEFGNGIIVLVIAGCGVYAAITIPLSIVNQYNKIRVSEDGLYIQVYELRYIWKFVPWKDILDIRLSPILDRWGKSQWLIKVRNLTYWHQVISWQYRCGKEPRIVLNSDLIERDKLLRIIDKQRNNYE